MRKIISIFALICIIMSLIPSTTAINYWEMEDDKEYLLDYSFNCYGTNSANPFLYTVERGDNITITLWNLTRNGATGTSEVKIEFGVMYTIPNEYSGQLSYTINEITLAGSVSYSTIFAAHGVVHMWITGPSMITISVKIHRETSDYSPIDPLEELRDDVAALNSTIADMQSAISNQSVQIGDLNNSINEMNDTIANILDNITNLWNAIEGLNETISNLKDKDKENEDRWNFLQENITEILINISLIENDINNISYDGTSLVGLEYMIEETNNDLDQLESDFYSLASDYVPNPYNDTALRTDHDQLKIQNDALKERLTLRDEEVNVLKVTINDLEKKVYDLEAEKMNRDSLLFPIFLGIALVAFFMSVFAVWKKPSKKSTTPLDEDLPKEAIDEEYDDEE